MANIKKLKVNNALYDIKDEISRGLIGTESGSAIGTAVGDNTKTDIVAALAKLKADIENKDVGVTNVSADTSTTGKIVLKQSKNGGAAQAITNAEIGTATLTIQKNSTNVATFGANASSNVTANIEVPVHATNPTSASDETGFTTPKDVADQIENALTGRANFRGLIETNIAWPPVSVDQEPAFEQGDYWVVKDAGNYPAGASSANQKYLEAGDMVFAITNDNSSRTDNNIWTYCNVVQSNFDLSDYAKLDENNDFTGTNTFKNVTIDGSNSGGVQTPGYLTIGNHNSGIILNGGFNTITDNLTGETLKDVLDGKLDKNVNDTLGGGTANTHVETTVGQYHDIVGSNNGFAWIKDGSNVTLESRLTAISGNDKLKDYGYISVSISNTNETGKFSPTTSSYTAPGASSATTGTVYSNIQRAVTNSQLPILSLSLSGLTSTIPVVMYNNMETGSVYFGQAILRKGDSTSQYPLRDYYITVQSTSSTTTVIISEPVSATYNSTDELLSVTIPFANSVTYGYAPTTVSN